MTQKELSEETRLSERTVRYALERLESIGIVEEDIYVRDARQNLYRITEPSCATCGYSTVRGLSRLTVGKIHTVLDIVDRDYRLVLACQPHER